MRRLRALKIGTWALTIGLGIYLHYTRPAVKFTPTNTKIEASEFEEKVRRYKLEELASESIELNISRELFLKRKNELRPQSSQVLPGKYAKAPELYPLFDKIRDSDVEGSDIEKVQKFMIANFTYQFDKGKGYAKYPLETLVEKGGDCEDLTFFAASALSYLGRDCIFVLEPRHICLGVELRKGEEPYSVKIATADTKIFMEITSKLSKENPDMKMEDVIKLYDKDPRLKKTIKTAKVIEHNGKKYQLIECTQNDIYSPKTEANVQKVFGFEGYFGGK